MTGEVVHSAALAERFMAGVLEPFAEFPVPLRTEVMRRLINELPAAAQAQILAHIVKALADG